MIGKSQKSIMALLAAIALFVSCAAGCGAPAQPETPEVPAVDTPTPETPDTPAQPEFNFDYTGYTMVWNDEFDAPELSRDDWNVELHDPGWVNEEWQAYVDSEENIYIEDGNLVLKPVKGRDKIGQDVYTSGRVNTQGKHDFTYGLFEARVKVPTGMGYLPAFWLMASDENLYGQWPRCGEIDIMEVMGQDTTTAHGTVHYGNPHGSSQGTYVLSEGNFSDEYHVFSLEWEPGLLRWYIDGELYHEESSWYSTTVDQGTVTYPAPFDQPFYIILNLAIGGSWVGYPDSTTTFEDQQYTIDYVRVYQKDFYDENVELVEEESAAREPDETGNYVINGDFAIEEPLVGDTEDWYFLTAQNGVGNAYIKDGELHIDTEKPGVVDYSIQLVQPNYPVDEGGTYRLTFDARADEERTAKVCVSAPERNWIRYLADTKFDVGPEKKTYEFTFTVDDPSDPHGRLEFNLGYQGSKASFHLSNVRLEKIAQAELGGGKKVLADGNYVYNGAFQEGKDRLGFWSVNKGSAEVSVTNENNVRRLMIVAGDDVSEENPVVVYQTGMPLAANSDYAVSYFAQGPAGNTLKAMVAGIAFDLELDGTEQALTGTFKTGDEFGTDISFTVTQPGTYYIDDVSVMEDRMIKNGSFNAGLVGYAPFIDASANANYVVDSLSEDNAFDITINDTGDVDWKIQLIQKGVKLEQGKTYRLTLDIKSDKDRKVMVALQRDGALHGEDWTPYLQQTVDVTGNYTTYVFEFVMDPATAPFSDPDTVLSISMGAVAGIRIEKQHRICIDNILLEEIG